jgi:hypothetical protein
MFKAGFWKRGEKSGRAAAAHGNTLSGTPWLRMGSGLKSVTSA